MSERSKLLELRDRIAAMPCVNLKDETVRLSHIALDYPHNGSFETLYRLEVLAEIDSLIVSIEGQEDSHVDAPAGTGDATSL
jgi:hypothetical protein